MSGEIQYCLNEEVKLLALNSILKNNALQLDNKTNGIYPSS
jgi:hypothetical protein